ncbi:MAG: TetR/AcrR family transcriptional regulator [Muribaculaceae bacterium]|nr:TetR/AcrR family transcriptional regulator [Muribaculaceae bacterium]
MRNRGDVTKKRLLDTALLLFTQKPYEKVTLREIEGITNLSRGALMHHASNKETLFKQAVDMFVFGNNTLTALPESERGSLEQTIRNFMKMLAREQEHWREVGIRNINYALFNVQSSYYSTIPGSLKIAKEWYENECSIWREVIEKAIETGEIRNVDADLFAHIFEDCYFGDAYASITGETGYSLPKLEEQLMAIYELLKK